MKRFRCSSGWMAWALAGGLGLTALCAALGAGLSVIQAAAAGQAPAHLPAASPRASGAVVEWQWATPEARRERESEFSTASGDWMEISSVPIAAPAQPSPGVPENVGTARAEPLPGALRIHLPVEGRVTQGFGCSPYYTGRPGPGCPAEAFWFHDGVDIAVPSGMPLQAGLSGTVVFAAADGDGPLCNRGYRGYGLAVVVDGEDGWQALYAHLSRIDVAVGDVVRPDAVLGATGETGCVSGAHLHFGLRHADELVDPLAAVR
jgi:murein DD-endopeptidase MepM/ murein hydrolase activator NlpD